MAKHFRRKKINFFIKKDLQGKLTWQFFLLTIGGLLVVLAIFSALTADHMTISYENNAVQISSTPFMLLRELVTRNWAFFLSTGLVMVLTFILLTHKIAGPIYRFEVVTKNMCKKDLDQPIYLRKHDEAKELGDSLNQFNHLLSDDIRYLMDKSQQIDDSIHKNNLELALQENQNLQKTLKSYILKQPNRK